MFAETFITYFACQGITRVHQQAVQAFVRQAMGYIDHTPDKETKVELIKTLQTVTEGKVRCLPSFVVLFQRFTCKLHASSSLALNLQWLKTAHYPGM